MAIGRRRRRDQPAWMRDPLWARARMAPSLDLRFAETQSLTDWVSGQQLVTFTRASAGSRVTATGEIESLANDVPRFTFDPVTGRCLGLLMEEARTNLLLNSATLSTQNVTVAATPYTLSFTGTGSITRSGVSTGTLNGTGTGEANRVSVTFTPTAGTLTLTVSETVTNAQLEAGSFRTSWISTTGTSASRAADIVTITGANFSQWYWQDQSSIFCDYTLLNPSTGYIFSISDNTNNNYVAIRYLSTQHQVVSVAASVAGTNIFDPTAAGVLSAKTAFGMGATWNVRSNSSFTASANATATNAVPTVDRVIFAASQTSGARTSILLRRFCAFRVNLPVAAIQRLAQ